jgi:hypothetical protein
MSLLGWLYPPCRVVPLEWQDRDKNLGTLQTPKSATAKAKDLYWMRIVACPLHLAALMVEADQAFISIDQLSWLSVLLFFTTTTSISGPSFPFERRPPD